MVLFGLQIDGSWIDDFSYVVAVVWMIARYMKRRRQPVRRPTRRPHALKMFFCRVTAMDFACGVCVFPLCGLAASVFSDRMMVALISGNRLLLSVAGVVALFSVVEDF
jgi:cell division protein FtsW (lipid II flippase)